MPSNRIAFCCQTRAKCRVFLGDSTEFINPTNRHTGISVTSQIKVSSNTDVSAIIYRPVIPPKCAHGAHGRPFILPSHPRIVRPVHIGRLRMFEITHGIRCPRAGFIEAQMKKEGSIFSQDIRGTYAFALLPPIQSPLGLRTFTLFDVLRTRPQAIRNSSVISNQNSSSGRCTDYPTTHGFRSRPHPAMPGFGWSVRPRLSA